MYAMTYDKGTLALLVLVVVSGALITPITYTLTVIGSAEPVTWKTFNDGAGSFTIQYPSKWIPMNSTNPLGPIDVVFWYDGTDESYAYVGVYASPDSPPTLVLEK
jgi:hypothetical protein